MPAFGHLSLDQCKRTSIWGLVDVCAGADMNGRFVQNAFIAQDLGHTA